LTDIDKTKQNTQQSRTTQKTYTIMQEMLLVADTITTVACWKGLFMMQQIGPIQQLPWHTEQHT